MKIALISDAWRPQVNGVVRTLTNLTRLLEQLGHEMLVIHPDLFRTFPCPKYPSIHLAIAPYRKTARMLDEFKPDAIHIATEGPCGLAARRYCRRRKLIFTTSYHTQFPKYLNIYMGLPESPGYKYLKWFHGRAVRTLVPTESMRAELKGWGFANELVIWGRGVDLSMFHPGANGHINVPRPLFLNVGRVSGEKNLDAFAKLDLPGTKIIIGEGPVRPKLQERYPDVMFLGFLEDEKLAEYYAAADVFVFPSRTDTFGNVMLEAMASGTPVAAYPVTGPVDVVSNGQTGVLDEDLKRAAMGALALNDRAACRRYAESLPWSRLVKQFENYLAPIQR
ncbi:MAG: glycosyltransferase [Planctomycetes bacterium]|nr:glycosyltransferase [Planctomycetota bacterium]